MAEFDNWVSSIISTYDFPDNLSVRFAIATMIMHQGSSTANLSKHYVSLLVKASMSKQIASAKFQEIKQQADTLATIEKQKTAEATATPQVANVVSIQN